MFIWFYWIRNKKFNLQVMSVKKGFHFPPQALKIPPSRPFGLFLKIYPCIYKPSRNFREVIELPLLNPELFLRVGITPPKVSINYFSGLKLSPPPHPGIVCVFHWSGTNGSLSLIWKMNIFFEGGGMKDKTLQI